MMRRNELCKNNIIFLNFVELSSFIIFFFHLIPLHFFLYFLLITSFFLFSFLSYSLLPLFVSFFLSFFHCILAHYFISSFLSFVSFRPSFLLFSLITSILPSGARTSATARSSTSMEKRNGSNEWVRKKGRKETKERNEEMK